MPPSSKSVNDPTAAALRAYAQNIFVTLFGLLPLVFIPTTVAPYEYTKILFIIIGVLVALVLLSLAVLREGSVRFSISYPLLALWVVVGVAFISSLLSGDLNDSLFGDVLTTHTTGFLAVLALAMSVFQLLEVPKGTIIRLYVLLAASTLALVVFHVIRLIAGPDTLSMGIFTGNVSTPMGSWNDLALFLGLSVILSLVAIEQLSLSRSGKFLFSLVIIFALFMLGVINFFAVWLVLGLASLSLIVYGLIRDRYGSDQPMLLPQKTSKVASLTLALIVFAVSVLFIIGGAGLGSFISKHTGITYIEVRPSLSATIDIARNVYLENAFFGIGPNRFADAWRLFKDPSINTTVFWNTDFLAGNGYVSTFFVTTGIVGGIAWVVFLGLFFFTGMRLLLIAPETDRFWYFIGVSSFVSALYIWGMSIVYVPGAVVLLIGALVSAIMLTANTVLTKPRTYDFSILSNRRTGFILTLFVIGFIVASVSVLYSTGRHYFAVYTFNESVRALQENASLDDVTRLVESAHQLYPSDIYSRRLAELNLSRLTALIGTQVPTEEQQREFDAALAVGLERGIEATRLDPTEPGNYSVLGNIYSLLSSTNLEGVHDRAISELSIAKELNPRNPLPYLDLAVSEGRVGNYDNARGHVSAAIDLKPNLTDAIFYLSQLDIVTGNVEGAIQSTLAIIRLEPNNPARYYQLGVLETSRQNLEAAIIAFERAVALDENYANARYLLALAYDAKGRSAEAKVQLERVLALNPGNPEVQALINILENEGSLQASMPVNVETPDATTPVREGVPVQTENGTVTTEASPDTPLVSPVNVPPEPNTGTAAPESIPSAEGATE
jgi:tetratricopeptide (TPR) repeat protein